MKLLLLSNSTMKGQPYLDWSINYIDEFLRSIDELLFIPYAGVTISYDTYTQNVRNALKPTSTQVTGIHAVDDKIAAIQKAQAIAVGGGNTYHLLKSMQDLNLLESIGARVKQGIPYIGWSAGSNVACPTIMTTNDMPIVSPDSFAALNLTAFQINAHFTEKTIEGHGGESRALRLEEFLVANPEETVIGLPEGKLLEHNSDGWSLKGIDSEPTYIFRHNEKMQEILPGKFQI